jgi:hypothetical protein
MEGVDLVLVLVLILPSLSLTATSPFPYLRYINEVGAYFVNHSAGLET